MDVLLTLVNSVIVNLHADRAPVLNPFAELARASRF